MRKKVTALLLLAVFLMNAAGYFKVYEFMRQKTGRTYQEMHLHQKNLLAISTVSGEGLLKEKGFKKLKKGEYIYRGHRYDVVKKQKKGDRTIIYLARDSYEEKILTFLTSFYKLTAPYQHDQAQTKLKHDMLKQYLASDYVIHKIHFQPHDMFKPATYYHPTPPYREILLPPPQQV